MRQLMRLLRYLVPYLFQLIAGSSLLAAVGLLFTFRLVLLRPILDRVLNPSSGTADMQLLVQAKASASASAFPPGFIACGALLPMLLFSRRC